MHFTYKYINLISSFNLIKINLLTIQMKMYS